MWYLHSFFLNSRLIVHAISCIRLSCIVGSRASFYFKIVWYVHSKLSPFEFVFGHIPKALIPIELTDCSLYQIIFYYQFNIVLGWYHSTIPSKQEPQFLWSSPVINLFTSCTAAKNQQSPNRVHTEKPPLPIVFARSKFEPLSLISFIGPRASRNSTITWYCLFWFKPHGFIFGFILKILC